MTKTAVRLLAACSLSLMALFPAMPARAEIQLELTSTQHEYLPDQAVFVSIAFVNTGPDEAEVVNELSLGLDTTSIFVTTPDGKTKRFVYYMDIDYFTHPYIPMVLAPGDRYGETFEITTQGGTMECLLSTPGEYLLTATYMTPNDVDPRHRLDISSKPLRLTVLECTGDDKPAHDKLAAVDARLWCMYDSQVKPFREVIARYPNSPYARQARYALAERIYCRAAIADKPGSPESIRDAKLAAEVFAGLAKEFTGSLGLRCALDAGRAYGMARNVEQSLAWFGRAFTSPVAEVNDRRDTLRQIDMFAKDYWQTGQAPTVPLSAFISRYGVKASWNPTSRSVSLNGPRLRAVVYPDKGELLIAGRVTPIRAEVRDGQTMVSVDALKKLISERYRLKTRKPVR